MLSEENQAIKNHCKSFFKQIQFFIIVVSHTASAIWSLGVWHMCSLYVLAVLLFSL